MRRGIMLANCKTAGISRARLIELLRDWKQVAEILGVSERQVYR